jgi:NADH-quinone oxidoreductase subunit F
MARPMPTWDRFPRERTWLLPALDAEQRAHGHVSPEAVAAIAAHVRVPLSEAWGVATHYPELRLTAPGRRVVRICTGLSCRLRGGDQLLDRARERLDVRRGATTGNGTVSVETIDCVFRCSVAPVVIAGACIGRVELAMVDQLLESGVPWPGPHVEAPSSAHPPLPVTLGALGRLRAGERFAALQRHAARLGPRARLAVGLGTCGFAVGAAETYEALRSEVIRRDLPWTVIRAGCGGACWAAPAVTVTHGGHTWLCGPILPAQVHEFVEALVDNAVQRFAVDPQFGVGQRRVVFERCGVTDPGDIADAIRLGAYAAFAEVVATTSSERLIEEVRGVGLLGRGGAYFQAAVKWEAARAAKGTPKYVVVNGEEGEPGIFKDRHLMEGDPHGLLEGVLLAALAVGASQAIVYIHGEADLAAARMVGAIDQARAWGLLGEGILGSTFSLDVRIRRGLGGFVLGEETALLESIEGRRAMPRTRPPFPAEAGLWGRPTVVNNVETLCAVPRIIRAGGSRFAGVGNGQGTKLFGLSGHVRRPGVVEVEFGSTLRTLIETIGGGSSSGKPIRAAVVGGPSGIVVHPRDFDTPLVPRGALNPGTGGVIALDNTVSVRDVVHALLEFNARESCGKCTPCREGAMRLLDMLVGPIDSRAVKGLAEVMQLASLCGLGQSAPLAVLSGLAHFAGDFGLQEALRERR